MSFTKIPNQLLELLPRSRLNGTQRDLIMVVIRRTCGYHKGQAEISLRNFQEVTRRERSNISRELKRLVARGILVKGGPATFTQRAKWGVNLNVEEWRGVAESTTVGEKTTVVEKTTEPLSNSTTPTVVDLATPIKKRDKEKKEKSSGSAKSDPCFQPLKVFVLEKYREVRGASLAADGSDYKSLSSMLKTLPDVPLEALMGAFVCFLESTNSFHQDQGKPLRWWANNINPFLASAGRTSVSQNNDLPLLN